HTAMLRKALAECISEDDVMDLGRSLYLAARNGDWVAAKLLLSYVIGKPAPPADPDTLEANEWGVFKALPVSPPDLEAVMGGMQAKRPNRMAGEALPILEAKPAKVIAQTLRTGEIPPEHQDPPRRPKKARPDRPSNGANGSNGSNGPRTADGSGRPPT